MNLMGLGGGFISGGAGGGGSGYVAVTSYNGNGGTLPVVTGQNLSLGSMAWLKLFSGGTGNHGIFDTTRGATKLLIPNLTNPESVVSGITSFDATGFTLGSDSNYNSSNPNVAFTWPKLDGYMDIVTWTGTGTTRTVAHTLGATPKLIIIHRINSNAPFSEPDWAVYHESTGATYGMALNTAAPYDSSASYWNNTAPTSSVFTVGNNGAVNASGGTYVAYLFGEVAARSKFGSYPATSPSISITGFGFTPQVVLAKAATASSPWRICFKISGTTYNFRTDSTAARDATGLITLDVDGFSVLTTDSAYPNTGSTNIYGAW